MTAEEVKALRGRMNKSQAQFAELVGTHKRTVRRWENREVDPSPLAEQTLQRLLEALESPEDAGATRRHTLPDVVE